MKLNQDRAPIKDALIELKKNKTVPFDVPGHKRGRGNPDLVDFLGEKCLSVDTNSQKCLDNLCHPISVIKEAEELAADAFGAAYAFLMVGGTTASVQSMIFASVKRGDKILLPRNVHRSVINALVLCGAYPVYISSQIEESLGIAVGITLTDVKKAIDANPTAKAILINNPTYYGICSDLKSIVELAHSRGLMALVDEAHGTHFYFGDNMPISAMAAGADFASVSMHKSGGSLTQSSILLIGDRVNKDYVRQIINLTQSTSGSYLLMSSLDISRKTLALNGKSLFKKVMKFASYAREEIELIGDYLPYSKKLIDGKGIFNFDETKLSVSTVGIGLAGIEVYDILRDEYDIQIEFGDLGNILAYISVGDKNKNIERLISALAEIKRCYKKEAKDFFKSEYIIPHVELSPQQAFYAETEKKAINRCLGEIACEFVMCYPPGIPILAPGERVTKEALDYIKEAKSKGCLITGPQSMDIDYLQVYRGEGYNG